MTKRNFWFWQFLNRTPAGILPEVKEDPDMKAIVISAAEKLKRISDEEFSSLDLEAYREELKDEDEEGADA